PAYVPFPKPKGPAKLGEPAYAPPPGADKTPIVKTREPVKIKEKPLPKAREYPTIEAKTVPEEEPITDSPPEPKSGLPAVIPEKPAPQPTPDTREVSVTATVRLPSKNTKNANKVISTSEKSMWKTVKKGVETVISSGTETHVQLSIPGERDIVTIKKVQGGVEIEMPNSGTRETFPTAGQAADAVLRLKRPSIDFVKNNYVGISDFVGSVVGGLPKQTFHLDDSQGPVFTAEILEKGMVEYQKRGLPPTKVGIAEFMKMFNMHPSQKVETIVDKGFESGTQKVLNTKQGPIVLDRVGPKQRDFRLFHTGSAIDGGDVFYYGTYQLRSGEWPPTIAQRISKDGVSEFFEVKTISKDGKMTHEIIPLTRPLTPVEERAIRMSSGSVSALMKATATEAGKRAEKVGPAKIQKRISHKDVIATHLKWIDDVKKWKDAEIKKGRDVQEIKDEIGRLSASVWKTLKPIFGEEEAKKQIDSLFEGLLDK
ncbi:MAG: hypothetical protein GOV01_03230, partial [Candidatus Altiarchaeota archaeon]|nr:hypothetical protein [Candidatus Altiarchaeota archaeon]